VSEHSIWAAPRRRTAIVLALGVLVTGSATLFGYAFAAEEHGHGDEAVEHEMTGHEAQSEPDRRGADAVASAILIGLAGGAFAPLAAMRGRRDATLAVGAAALSIGAAAIHFAVIAQHLDEWWLAGAFFIGVGLFQLAWAAAALLRPSQPLYVVGAVVNCLVILTWIVSRTAGVPIGPEAGEAEPVGLPDVVSTVYEALLVGLICAVGLRPARLVGGVWLPSGIVAAVTALALAALA
jgi:hypothetical protein